MKLSIAAEGKRDAADLLVLPFWEGAVEAADISSFKKMLRSALASDDFKGKLGEGLLFYPEGEKEFRLLLLGLGEEKKASAENLRRAYSNAVRTAQGKKLKSINFYLPKTKLPRKEVLEGVVEGVLLTNYAFNQFKGHKKENLTVLLEKASFIGLEKKEAALLEEIQTVVEGVHFVRELVNGNADEVIPKMLADTALAFEKEHPKIKTTVFDRKRLEKEKMGLILAVGRAASVDPCLIQVSYQGAPQSKEHVVLVGKGITYDTGGLSLKPTDNMLTMKCDMSGAATVLGAVKTAAALGLKVNVTALVPSAENAMGPKSYKLGDVYSSYLGKTVEITNTDAEGRLVLADALAFAVKELKPTCMVDVASLTGAIVIALGDEVSGLFASDEALAKDLLAASDKTAELLWRMPLHPGYKESLKSDIADLMNSSGREAGSVRAALFLQEFVGQVPWAHIDFAGSCYLNKPKYYNSTKATGFGLRLFIDFLRRRSA